MGQVFTIKFKFKEEQHVATVTVCHAQSEQLVYYVRLFNPDFHKIIPGCRIRFTSTENSLTESMQRPLVKELFQSIKDAVSAYLNQKSARAELLKHELPIQNADPLAGKGKAKAEYA
jgi:hypothetical protein